MRLMAYLIHNIVDIVAGISVLLCMRVSLSSVLLVLSRYKSKKLICLLRERNASLSLPAEYIGNPGAQAYGPWEEGCSCPSSDIQTACPTIINSYYQVIIDLISQCAILLTSSSALK